MDSSSSSTDSLLQLLAWLEKNKQKVMLITGAVVVVAGLVAAVVYYQSQKEVRASEKFSNIRATFNSATPGPGALQAYLNMAQDFEGTKAAGRALLEAATLLYGEGNYPGAEARYKQFLNEYPESPFQPQGMFGLASTVDAEGKTSEAITKYEELLRRYPTDSVAFETKLSLARLKEKSNPAEAYKLYNDLVALGSQSALAAEAGIRREDLVEKNPDLVKTNTPVAPVVPPTVTPVPQVNSLKPAPTNPAVTASTNLQNRPSTVITIPPPNASITASPPRVPELLKSQAPTNKP
jgi:TolA-binding protein